MEVFCLLTFAAAASAFGRNDVTYPVHEKEHVYYDGELALNGRLMYQDIPDAKERAGLLIFPFFMGSHSEPEKDVARSYAEQGMVVFMADYYGKNYSLTDFAQIGEALTKSYPEFLADWPTAHRRALLSLEQLTGVPSVSENKIGVMGFCMGGAVSSVFARAGGKAEVVVSYHGDNTPKEDEADKGFNIKYFASFFGRNDPVLDATTVVPSSEAWLTSATKENGDFETVVFSNTVHGFTRREPESVYDFLQSNGFGGASAYNPRAAKATFDRTDSLFREYGLLD